MNSDTPRSHGLLTNIQKKVLEVFIQVPDQLHFYLTGGTALAEYYFGHRLSYDLDFFTGQEGLVQPFSRLLERTAETAGIELKVVRRFSSYTEYLASDGFEQVKIDLAQDSPFRFLAPVKSSQGFMINNAMDLFTDKLLAFYGRAEPRDAVDLFYILLQRGEELLLDEAKQKDSGFDLYWFAIALNRSMDFPDEKERWPVKMLVDWDPSEIKSRLTDWAQRLMSKLM